jgi:hypothetical protein
LLRVEQLHVDCLRQADILTPTQDHAAAWLEKMHALPAGSIDPTTLAVPATYLLAMPLFRLYLVNELCGSVRNYIHTRLEPADQKRLSQRALPAHEFHQVLHQWNDCLTKLHEQNYEAEVRHGSEAGQDFGAVQGDRAITFTWPEVARQFTLLCALPPTKASQRKTLLIGGLHHDFPLREVAAYPQLF